MTQCDNDHYGFYVVIILLFVFLIMTLSMGLHLGFNTQFKEAHYMDCVDWYDYAKYRDNLDLVPSNCYERFK